MRIPACTPAEAATQADAVSIALMEGQAVKTENGATCCHYTMSDRLKFNLYTTYWGSKAYLALMGIAVLTLLVDAALVRENIQFLITPAVLVALANLYLFFHIVVISCREARTAAQVEFRLFPDLFHIRASFGDVRFKWKDFYKIAQTPNYFYLYLARRTAFIVPKRLLNPEEKALLAACRAAH